MVTDSQGWWSRHGWTVALLLSAFGLAFAVRSIWTIPVLNQFGNLYVYAGGSDSYYHSRVMQFIISNHRTLIFDPLLNYPIGAINPREPLFDWMNAILGIVFAPLFGGNADNAGAFFLNLQAPLWAALSVFPIYLIGREVGDRRTGIIAGFIFAFLPATITESIFGYGNYLSFYTFIILVVIYSYIRTVRAVGSRRWVDSYRHPRSIVAGLRGLWRTERTAIKWAVFTGVGFGTLALAWQGYTYAIAVIGVFIIVAMLIERIRKVDSFGLYVVTWIVGLVGFPIAMPYYYFQHQFVGWFDLPLLLFFGILLLLLPFLVLRDYPWVVSIPAVIGIYFAGGVVLLLLNPTYFTEIVTGQGYFVKTLIYSTVAEAQAPSFDTLAISYGVVTFFLAFVGVGLYGWALIRSRFPRWLLVFLIFAILSIYLPISASKFLLLGSPAFALLGAEALRRLWDLGGYSDLRQGVNSLADTRSRLTAIRKSFKARHVLIVLLVVGLLVPNVWYGMDAGIPSNVKAQASDQVYHSLPSWLQAPASQASSFYFGAAGSAIDTPNLYDSAGYSWLAQQDTAIPQPERPALIAWWDYGFQTIDQGQHPSVADNFQNGIDPSGQFLLSQNQSIAIGVLSTTLLYAELVKDGGSTLPSGLTTVLASNGIKVATLMADLTDRAADYNAVVANPQIYMPVNPATLTDLNAVYMVTSYYLATLTPTAVAQVYNAIQQYTGWSIRYAMADSRLIPFSGTSTGIYYAPADLTGRLIDSGGNPETYFNVTVLGSNGQYYPSGQVPPSVQAVNYYVNYFAPFYNSMIYRIYFGYNGTDIGLSAGIPGLAGSLTSYPIEPGWMESHFMVQYQTAYYCPTPSQAASQGCFYATNRPTAEALAASQGGVANLNASAYFGGGESVLVYYAGQPMTGTVTLPNGVPVAGARVTVDDGWGIPHQSVVTGPNGEYSILLPPGNDTVNVTIGTLQGLSQQGNIVLDSIPIQVSPALGYSFSAPTLVRSIVLDPSTVSGIVYWNIANSTAYVPTIDPVAANAQVVLWGVANGSRITTSTDAGGTFQLTNVPPGVYDYSVLYQGANYTQTSVYVNPASSPVNASAGLTPANLTGTVSDSSGAPIALAAVTIQGANGLSLTVPTDNQGTYTLQDLGPGNYTLTAVGPSANERSLGTSLVLTSIGEHKVVNLVEAPVAPVSFTVSAGGLPLANVPVRLTPDPGGNGTSPVASYVRALANATVLTSNAAGVVSGYIPVGRYSVYAATVVGSTLEAAVGSLDVSTAASAVIGPSLILAPAGWLTGAIVPSAGANSTSVVVAFSSGGASTYLATTNGSFAVAVPFGNYTVLTLQSPTGSSSSLDAALQAASVPSRTSLAVDPVVAIRTTVAVTTPIGGSGEYPAAGTTATLSIGGGPIAISVPVSAGGNASLIAPSSLANGQTYCFSVAGYGYASAQECGIAPGALSSFTHLSIAFVPVALTLDLTGAPGGAPVTVYLNGTSATAPDYMVTGTSTVTVSVNPGNYTVAAIAPGTPGRTLYMSRPGPTLTLPLGSGARTESIALQFEVNATGTLLLPAGLPASNVTIELTGGTTTAHVNGTAYTHGFYVAPGSYSAYSVGTSASGSFTNLTGVTVSNGGIVSPTVRLGLPGYVLSGTLVAPNGTVVPATTTVVLTSSAGAVARASATAGRFSITLPAGTSYTATSQATVVTGGPNGSYFVEWSTVPGGSVCSVGAAPSTCQVSMTGSVQPVWFNGTVGAPGYSGFLPSTLTLVGPYPAGSRTTIAAPNGVFSVSVAPGAYTLYVTSDGATSAFANLSSVTILPSSGAFSVRLSDAWQDLITIQSPGGGGIAPSSVTLNVLSVTGARWAIDSAPLSVPIPLTLPIGVYSLRANATGSPYGALAAAQALGSATILGGNTATRLSLAWSLTTDVSGLALGTGRVDLPASGGLVQFSVTLTNHGSAPTRVSVVVSPAYWTVSTSLTNVTLGVTAPTNTTSGIVSVLVPAGTLVAHPALIVSIVNASSDVPVATVKDPPTVFVAPSYGLTLAPSSSPAQVGATHVLVPFSVTNTGNLIEGLSLTVVNAAQLASLGWTANIAPASATTPTVDPGTSVVFSLNLTASGPTIPPATGVVAVEVLNATGGLQRTISLTIPSTQVAIQPGLTVTGPSLGSAPNVLPTGALIALALVPAIVVGLLLGIWRWNRTRRWQRW